jgi:hypothetical protein
VTGAVVAGVVAAADGAAQAAANMITALVKAAVTVHRLFLLDCTSSFVVAVLLVVIGQRMAAVHVRFLWATCEGTVTPDSGARRRLYKAGGR